LPTTVPAPLRAVIARCLDKDRDERYPGGNDVREALEAVQAGTARAPRAGWQAVLTRPRVVATVAAATALSIIAAMTLAFDVAGLRTRLMRGAATPARAIKLAVLPFANLSGDATQEYLSDGITQEMIAQLGRLHPETLSVIARTSVMRYKGTERPVDQIGRELGVDYILEGSAQREASTVRITAELIKVADQTQLWADRFEREMASVLALQNDVARKVAGALAPRETMPRRSTGSNGRSTRTIRV
jgi:TolB-like protein